MDQIRAEFGTIDQLAADQGRHAGAVTDFRDQLRQAVSVALHNFDGGLGEAEHRACMLKAEQLIDEHISHTSRLQGTTHQVNDVFQTGGQTARRILSSGA